MPAILMPTLLLGAAGDGLVSPFTTSWPPCGHFSATVPNRDGVHGIWQRPFKGREFMRRRDCQLDPRWADVGRLFAGLDVNRSTDVRDRAILMLFAIYGLRESEVAKLRLDDIDWEHDQLRIPRAKRREAQVYPLLPSVGRALTDYLLSVRRSTSHREIFLTLVSPYCPLSRSGLYDMVAARLKSLNVQCSSSRTPQSEACLCGSIGCARVVPQRDRRSSRTSQHFCYPCLCEGGSARLA